jgi:hypothetical protein
MAEDPLTLIIDNLKVIKGHSIPEHIRSIDAMLEKLSNKRSKTEVKKKAECPFSVVLLKRKESFPVLLTPLEGELGNVVIFISQEGVKDVTIVLQMLDEEKITTSASIVCKSGFTQGGKVFDLKGNTLVSVSYNTKDDSDLLENPILGFTLKVK